MAVDDKAGEERGPVAQPVEFPELPSAPVGKPLVRRSVQAIRDVQVNVAAILGEAQVSVERLFSLREGDVLELQQAIDSPVDVLVENNLVARGKIVVVGDRFGVLITSISEA